MKRHKPPIAQARCHVRAIRHETGSGLDLTITVLAFRFVHPLGPVNFQWCEWQIRKALRECYHGFHLVGWHPLYDGPAGGDER